MAVPMFRIFKHPPSFPSSKNFSIVLPCIATLPYCQKSMARLLLLLALLSMASMLVSADTHSDCGLAETAFGMCIPYVMGNDPQLDPKCCNAVQSVNDLASTPKLRRDICDCLRKMLIHAGKINSGRLAGLPGKCRINTNVIPPSLTFDCSTIA
ncbi:non-specific lipid-transfer protein 1 [Elaeis guineensis]|uniref:non-specific lipid-transfer protein 1 n=1 Tax=Elaeis guineensis var. tenera TaxID=51953 RepID=UPI003C6D6C24